VHLWDLGDEPTELAALPAGARPVPAVSFSPDGRILAAGSHDGAIRLWDLSAPAAPGPVRMLTGLVDLQVTTTGFSPDGRHLLVSSTDSTLRIVGTGTWTVQRTLPHPDVVTWAEFTANGSSVVSVATHGAFRR